MFYIYIDSFSRPRRTGDRGSRTCHINYIFTWTFSLALHANQPNHNNNIFVFIISLSATIGADVNKRPCKRDDFIIEGFLCHFKVLMHKNHGILFLLSESLFKKHKDYVFSCVAVKVSIFYTTLYIYNKCK